MEVMRAGAILAVSDFERSLRFYRDLLGLEIEATYEDPPYATLRAAGARISLAEQGHPAPDRPGVSMTAPTDRSRLAALSARWACPFSQSPTRRRGAGTAASRSTPTGT